LLGLAGAFYLWTFHARDPWKVQVWVAVLILLTIAAALGAIAHGLKLPAKTTDRIWQPLNLALGLAIALFVVGVVYDKWGIGLSCLILPVMIGLACLFFILTRLYSKTFLVFIIYQSVAMLFALGVYGWLALSEQRPGALWLVSGVSLTILAATIQATKTVSLTFIWPFDHNGIYHLIQMVGMICLVLGLRTSLLAG